MIRSLRDSQPALDERRRDAPTGGTTVVWALRSPCNLRCRYCYFGTLDETTEVVLQPGALSHVGRTDASLKACLAFIKTMTPHLVNRVFLAGGEPLMWPGIEPVIDALKASGVQVVVCTNGQPLADTRLAAALIDSGVEAICVSLDSHDADYNDQWRVDRGGRGWAGVVEGIKTIVARRNGEAASTKIGIYMVVSRENIAHIIPTAHFVAGLGVDYFIIQPVSLEPAHQLHSTLSLTVEHYEALGEAISALTSAGLSMCLPNEVYLRLMLRTLSDEPLPIIRECFGGRDLFFIQPDGSVWDCPSIYKIRQTRSEQYESIVGKSASRVFSRRRRARNTDCSCFSQDCVNMWQLMAFDEIIVR
jgi:MoaA/NifB/PqqE/SkfB family radical SAM enzyme